MLTQVVEIDPALDAGAPGYMINDFGTNNTVAALLAAGLMVVGGLVWCAGHHWGAGLAGGAGASLAGWVALVLGVAEWQLADGDAAGSAVGRSPGFWILSGAGALGVLVLLASIARAGRLRRAGLDPWVAALAAMSFIIAAGGPLIPPDRADWSVNWSSESLPVELPTAFFAGRAVQLGLLAVCGVVGCLLVRRWGLGLAVGGALSSGWLLVTAATDRTDKPDRAGVRQPWLHHARAARRHRRRILARGVLLPGRRRHGPSRCRTLTACHDGSAGTQEGTFGWDCWTS